MVNVKLNEQELNKLKDMTIEYYKKHIELLYEIIKNNINY